MSVIRAPWTSASFLLYAGGLIILASAAWLLGTLSGDYGAAAFVGWSLLVLVFLEMCAFSFRQAARPLAAGLLALSAVVAFAVFVGALEDWFGWLAHTSSPFQGFHISLFLIELALLAAALVALRIFRFPLLVAVVAGTAWYFVTDLVSGGGDWSATVSIVVGLVLLLVALALDTGPSRPYGFWVHVVAGLTIGGGLLWFWHTRDLDWILLALAGFAFIAVADRVGRSSWAVLGAFGLLLSTTHWVDKWFGFPSPLPLFGFGGKAEHTWARPISYAALGFVFMVLAFVLHRREPVPPSAA